MLKNIVQSQNNTKLELCVSEHYTPTGWAVNRAWPTPVMVSLNLIGFKLLCKQGFYAPGHRDLDLWQNDPNIIYVSWPTKTPLSLIFKVAIFNFKAILCVYDIFIELKQGSDKHYKCCHNKLDHALRWPLFFQMPSYAILYWTTLWDRLQSFRLKYSLWLNGAICMGSTLFTTLNYPSSSSGLLATFN